MQMETDEARAVDLPLLTPAPMTSSDRTVIQRRQKSQHSLFLNADPSLISLALAPLL